ncbi:MAG: DUF4332 domain-containing protein [Planctomycetota bacterium]|nr:DUF4332 domain-containing protein [Planctomycetota bacterium]
MSVYRTCRCVAKLRKEIMDAIVAILRAAHCKSTHHYFAIDALNEVPSSRGKLLADLLMANYSDYLKGAKDPDNVFKDFENHVLHVRDGYWGGAAKTAEKWLEQSNRMLSAGNWKEAAYAIGVLSHYFSDPFMPLHTAQSPRETIVHRPLEWSVCCSYQSIFKMACEDSQLESFPIGSASNWLTDSILRGATMANRYYEPLMDDYDMKESSRHPELALGSDSRKTLAMIFTWVLTGWGSVIDRIANEASVKLPTTSLAVPTLLAGLQMPVKKVVAGIESVEQKREVERILDEFNRTGNVVRNVSPEQRIVQKIRKERPELRPEPSVVEQAVTSELMQLQAKPKVAPVQIKSNTIDSVRSTSNAIQPTALPRSPEPAKLDRSPPVTPPVSIIPTSPQVEPAHDAEPALQKPEKQVREVVKPSTEVTASEKTTKRAKLTVDSPIVDAPAIGPKSAARLEAIGLTTVRDLLSHDADSISAELQSKWITPRIVDQWQDQARLACQIERLSAAGSGLLIMAGIRTAEELIRLRPAEAHAMVRAAAQTSEGQRLLRDQEPPPLKTIERWIDAARASKKAA